MSRVVSSFTVGLAVTLVATLVLLPLLRRLRWGQSIRTEGPRSHKIKSGTPTMGGLAMLAGISAAVWLFGRGQVEILLVWGATLGYGIMGFADDFLKVRRHRSLGLRAREKLLGQVAVAVATVAFAMSFGRGTSTLIPFNGTVNLGYLYPFLAVLVMISFGNAVNLTDGLDGLAAGVTFIASLALVVVNLALGKPELAAFSGAIAGSCLGFLVFNTYPARVFMGDVGSMALGAAVASIGIMGGLDFSLLLIGGVFVVEALSVVLQVLSFRLTGQRIFRMTPLHHHFELLGWPETKVVVTFWLAALVIALAGIGGVLGFV